MRAAEARGLAGGRAEIFRGTRLATLISMSNAQWSNIPTKLKAKGFTVFYDRISYEPEHPLWCANANLNGRQWRTFGENLSAALLELEKQTREAVQEQPPTPERETLATLNRARPIAEHSMFGH